MPFQICHEQKDFNTEAFQVVANPYTGVSCCVLPGNALVVSALQCKTEVCQQLVQRHVKHQGYSGAVWLMGHTSSDPTVDLPPGVQRQHKVRFPSRGSTPFRMQLWTCVNPLCNGCLAFGCITVNPCGLSRLLWVFWLAWVCKSTCGM